MDVFLPRGTRDLLPEQMKNRLRVIEIVRGVFARFGFEPLETPAFERIETLTGKYGDEGDKLIYRILKRGEGSDQGESDLALRYDLTVPLARVMAMHPEIRLPFRRYQIQPVWRADRPQKGRFREFWQCDVDLVGSTSPLADAECVAVVDSCLKTLGFSKYTIRVNDRRILADMARIAGATNPKEETSVLIALDKLDKIGRDKVHAELLGRGFVEANLQAFWDVAELSGDNDAILHALNTVLSESGRQGVEVLRQLLQGAIALGVAPAAIQIDLTLARGLDYYTGPVFETVVDEPKIGSISGGGRYDELIGMFSPTPLPAVGVSLGLERLITVMEELGMLPSAGTATEVLVAQWGADTLPETLDAARRFREAGIRTELFTEPAKLAKQFKHANARGYRWLALVGADEKAAGTISLKDLLRGEQSSLSIADAIAAVQKAGTLDA